MRSHRRVFLPPVLAVLMTAAVAACGSSGSSTPKASSPPAASVPASVSTASASGSAGSAAGASEAATGAAAQAAIKSNWEAFFSGKTGAAKKISLLQNGQVFASVINAQAGSSLSSSASAVVTSVTITSATQAKVVYDVLLGGQTALSKQSGVAVYENGIWKVGDASFCGLLGLENGGKAPSVCSAAG
jgi:hypothetical protein